MSGSGGRNLSGNKGIFVNIVDVAGSSKWSHFVRKKRPCLAFRAQGVGSIVGVHCGPEFNPWVLIYSKTALGLLASCITKSRRCAHLFFTPNLLGLRWIINITGPIFLCRVVSFAGCVCVGVWSPGDVIGCHSVAQTAADQEVDLISTNNYHSWTTGGLNANGKCYVFTAAQDFGVNPAYDGFLYSLTVSLVQLQKYLCEQMQINNQINKYFFP